MDLITLEEILKSESLLSDEKVTKVTPVSGGCIHNAWQIKLATGKKIFAKTSPLENYKMLQFEADGLTAINKRLNPDVLIAPKPLALKKLTKVSILLMPWFELNQGSQVNLGKGLALFHKESSEEKQKLFGWENDGFIGNNSQIGGWETSWGKCFVKLRLEPQMKMAKGWGLSFKSKKFYNRIINFLEESEVQPSLVHGDLWKGNASVTNQGKGIIYDPATWWADREVDIAMTKLFGGFSNEFYNAYNSIWSLKDGFEKRQKIYNLYHVLNHANLFGGSYQNQSLSLMNQINIELKEY